MLRPKPCGTPMCRGRQDKASETGRPRECGIPKPKESGKVGVPSSECLRSQPGGAGGLPGREQQDRASLLPTELLQMVSPSLCSLSYLHTGPSAVSYRRATSQPTLQEVTAFCSLFQGPELSTRAAAPCRV